MSFFSKVFGGKKEAAAPSTAEAIQKLRETEDMLIKKQDFLETKIENEMMVAKKNASKNKRGSITILIACCLSSFKFQSYFYDLSIRTVSQW
jgi:charged multivesicular body protein 4